MTQPSLDFPEPEPDVVRAMLSIYLHSLKLDGVAPILQNALGLMSLDRALEVVEALPEDRDDPLAMRAMKQYAIFEAIEGGAHTRERVAPILERMMHELGVSVQLVPDKTQAHNDLVNALRESQDFVGPWAESKFDPDTFVTTVTVKIESRAKLDAVFAKIIDPLRWAAVYPGSFKRSSQVRMNPDRTPRYDPNGDPEFEDERLASDYGKGWEGLFYELFDVAVPFLSWLPSLKFRNLLWIDFNGYDGRLGDSDPIEMTFYLYRSLQCQVWGLNFDSGLDVDRGHSNAWSKIVAGKPWVVWEGEKALRYVDLTPPLPTDFLFDAGQLMNYLAPAAASISMAYGMSLAVTRHVEPYP